MEPLHMRDVMNQLEVCCNELGQRHISVLSLLSIFTAAGVSASAEVQWERKVVTTLYRMNFFLDKYKTCGYISQTLTITVLRAVYLVVR